MTIESIRLLALLLHVISPTALALRGFTEENPTHAAEYDQSPQKSTFNKDRGLLAALMVLLALALLLGVYACVRAAIFQADKEYLKTLPQLPPERFKPSTIKEITRDYMTQQISNINSSTSYCLLHNITYEGVLPNGINVYVKKFSTSWEGHLRFKEELTALCCLHDNIIQVHGYCISYGLYAIVSHKEFDNSIGSLDTWLQGGLLTWEQRVKIINGIAAAILHLQENITGYHLLHLDVRPQNILLDAKFNPKLTAFESCRSMKSHQRDHVYQLKDDTVLNSQYFAPERLHSRIVSLKTDVYSFGITMFEVMCGSKVLHGDTIASLARASILKGNAKHMFQEGIRSSVSDEDAVKYIHIALWSSHQSSEVRPDMSKVVGMLSLQHQQLRQISLPPSISQVNKLLEERKVEEV